MENIEENKKENYVKALLFLHNQIEEMKELNRNPIEDINNIWQCFLVNKDIIDNYKEIYLYSTISKLVEGYKEKTKMHSFNDEQNEKLFQFFIKKIGVDNSKLNIFEENIIPVLFEAEKLKIQNFEYPNNFFILKQDIKDLLFKKQIENKEIDNNAFIPYKTLIGKEGIFIWNTIKQNNNIVVYFLENCESEISKIYIYKEENDFLDELKSNIKGKTPKEYYKFRKISNNQRGYFNLIDDGNILFKYLNIARSMQYEELKEGNETKFEDVLTNIDKNNKIIRNFLKYLLINLYYIKDLREYCKELFLVNKENNLLFEFYGFITKFDKNNMNNLELETKKFIETFFNKKLAEAIIFNEGHESYSYEKIIRNVLKTFHRELTINKDKNYDNKIFKLFFGSQNIQEEIEMVGSNGKLTNITENFSTLYINSKKFINNNYTLRDIIIKNYPRIIILILDKSIDEYLKESQNRDSIVKIDRGLPLKLEIKDGPNYLLLSSIKIDKDLNEFISIIKEEKKIFSEKEKYKYLEFEQAVKESIIFFYEMIEQNYSSRNDIYNNYSQNISNSQSPVFNDTGYHDYNMKTEIIQ